MKIKGDCKPDMTIKHGIYGYGCENDEYNYDVCIIVGCDIGYELMEGESPSCEAVK